MRNKIIDYIVVNSTLTDGYTRGCRWQRYIEHKCQSFTISSTLTKTLSIRSKFWSANNTI